MVSGFVDSKDGAAHEESDFHDESMAKEEEMVM